MKSRALLVFLSVFLFFSCSKQLAPVTKKDFEAALSALEDVGFDYLAARAKIKYQDGKKNINATVNFRIKKDSLIWFSLSSGVGVEGARGMITRDSIKVIDRLNKEYKTYGFSKMSKDFKFNLTYDLIQAAIFGQMPITRKSSDQIKKEKTYFLVKQKDDNLSITNTFQRKTFLLEKVTLVQNPTSNTLNLVYGKHGMVGSHIFPYASFVDLKYAQRGDLLNTQITINYTKAQIEGDDLRFPFSIPQKYERK